MPDEPLIESEPELEYVGFWARFGAFLIDSILAAVVLTPLAHLFGGPDESGDLGFQMPAVDLLTASSLLPSGPMDVLISYVLPIAAVLAFWIARQATPGKMAISARIVDASTGSKPSAGQMIGRYFAYYVSIFGMFLGFAWIGWDPRKQGWHDKLAGTVVVRPKKRGVSDVRFSGR